MKYFILLIVLPFFCAGQAVMPLGKNGAKIPLGNSANRVPVGKPAYVTSLATNTAVVAATGNLKTAAGIYKVDTEGDTILVRTLWANDTTLTIAQAQSKAQLIWDGLDDNQMEVSNGAYLVKVLANRVNYKWEGVIGNTSSYTTGSGRHAWSDRIADLKIAGNYAYFTTGYQEGSPAQHKFNINTPNIVEELFAGDQLRSTTLVGYCVATDATRVYWSGLGLSGSNDGVTSVFSTLRSDDNPVLFSSGVSVNSSFPSCIDLVGGGLVQTIRGLAVSSSYIFVARKAVNSIHVLNKTTGALVQSLTITAPMGMYVDSDDKLWMIHDGNQVTKHTINSDGTISAALLTIPDLSEALSVQVSPDNTIVLVGDGGTNHVYKGFSNTTGTLLWTKGTPGGYATSPDVSYNKFIFRSSKEKRSVADDRIDMTFGAVQADNSLWLGDMGNQRLIHFDSDRTTVLGEIMNLGYTYVAAVDRADPTRAFCNWLEFEIDYSKPLQVGNGSWKLKRNWSWNITEALDNQVHRTKGISTLSNGRTYNIGNSLEEYTATGIRTFGFNFTPFVGAVSYNYDGSLSFATSQDVGGVITYTKRLVTGFDGSNNILWGNSLAVQTTPIITASDPVGVDWDGVGGNQVTSTNVLVSFAMEHGYVRNDIARGFGYHLGGLKNNKWIWKTARSTNLNYQGDFPGNGDFDVGNGVQYGGSMMTTLERSIFWGYHGEFWKASQTNLYNHVYDNGLLVGQFGVTGPQARGQGAYPGFAGNALVWDVVKYNADTYYLYHSDESQHGGMHRWKISDINSVSVLTSSLTKSGSLVKAPDYEDLMAGLPYGDVVTDGTAGWTRYPTQQIDNGVLYKQSVKTNVFTYQKNQQKDIYFENYFNYQNTNYRQNLAYLDRDLGTKNLSSWRLQGDLQYTDDTEDDSSTVEIHDLAGKKLIQFGRYRSGNTISLRVNGATIASGMTWQIMSVLSGRNLLNIQAVGDHFVVTFAAYAPVTVAKLDATAAITKPKKLRLKMTSYTNNRSHSIDGVFRFYNN